jgi:hypothetical protein
VCLYPKQQILITNPWRLCCCISSDPHVGTLPDPGIDLVPEVEHVEQEADVFLTHLIEKWRLPLCDLPEERFFDRVYTSRWEVEYCIEAMLEHAVMHPIRHEFQIINLIEMQKDSKK